VIAARTAPKPGSTITITGVVGGRLKPFVDGRAIFTVIDRSLICSTGCGSTWSGCGLPPEQLRGGVATVQVADASGKPLTTTLEGANGLEAGSSVVINGTIAAGSNDKALLINASAIHLTTPPAAAPH